MTTISEKFISEDGRTIKYIHKDGSENTLKIGLSCSGIQEIDKRKAVLFLSSSVGCQQGCRFCFLTEKGYEYHSITTSNAITSCIDIINDSKDLIKDRYLKLSFMGMGDVFSSVMDIFQLVTSVFDYAMKNNLILGIDGVDIGTSYPRSKVGYNRIFDQIERVNDVLFKERYPLSPYNKYSPRSTRDTEYRTVVRLFISMPSIDEKIKYTLMPRSAAPNDIYYEVGRLGVDIIFHCIFLDGVNDDPKNIHNMIFYFCESQYEVRLLRYNKCPGSMFEESWRIQKIIDTFKESPLKFKYQVSIGSEIKAACGMFVCKRVRE